MFAKLCPCFGLVLAAHIRWKPYILVVSSPGQCGLLSALCWWWAAYKLVLPWRGAAAAPTYFASYFLLQPVPTPPRLFSRLPASADRTGGARGVALACGLLSPVHGSDRRPVGWGGWGVVLLPLVLLVILQLSWYQGPSDSFVKQLWSAQ